MTRKNRRRLPYVGDSVDDPQEIIKTPQPTQPDHPCAVCGAAFSPFGVGFRPAPAEGSEQGRAVPFPTWEYRPPYLPEPLAIHMAANSDVATEPLLFYLAFGRRPNPDDPTGASTMAREQAEHFCP